MEDYKSLYFSLFGAVADATDALEQGNLELARTILIEAQKTAEENYISMKESEKGCLKMQSAKRRPC